MLEVSKPNWPKQSFNTHLKKKSGLGLDFLFVKNRFEPPVMIWDWVKFKFWVNFIRPDKNPLTKVLRIRFYARKIFWCRLGVLLSVFYRALVLGCSLVAACSTIRLFIFLTLSKYLNRLHRHYSHSFLFIKQNKACD